MGIVLKAEGLEQGLEVGGEMGMVMTEKGLGLEDGIIIKRKKEKKEKEKKRELERSWG